METSIFIARILALYYLIIGTGLLFNGKAFQRIMDDFSKNAALLLFAGILALVIGIVLILKHNIWINNWTVIITIIGWAAFIKGIWIIVFPDSVSRFMEIYRKNKYMLTIHATVAFIFGAVLSFFGFFAR